MSWQAQFVFENGRVFQGTGLGSPRETHGEVVFNTSLSGYQEILSDPSYAGQIVVMTATEIGNVGVNEADMEATRVRCRGLIARSVSPVVASWRGEASLADWMQQHELAGVVGLDTRAITRMLRDEGAMRGAIAPATVDTAAVLARVRAAPTMDGLDLATSVSCQANYAWDKGAWRMPGDAALAPAQHHVVAYDFGIKSSILRRLREHGIRTTVVPAKTSAADAMALRPDGIFLSNGPGDPAAVHDAIAAVRALVAREVPLFGICLGHQILALALGAKTYKLQFGHHGGNHPVKHLATGRVEITAQNHGFAVDSQKLPDGVGVTHVNLYDQTVEGLRSTRAPVFSVQYHPEASPGPHDADYLFAEFRRMLSA